MASLHGIVALSGAIADVVGAGFTVAAAIGRALTDEPIADIVFRTGLAVITADIGLGRRRRPDRSVDLRAAAQTGLAAFSGARREALTINEALAATSTAGPTIGGDRRDA